MHRAGRKIFGLILVFGILLACIFHSWSPGTSKPVDVRARLSNPIKKLLIRSTGANNSVEKIPYNIKEDVASRLDQPTCVCHADEKKIQLPFSNLLFPRVWAHNLDQAFLEFQSDPEGVKHHRAQEYSKFQQRSYSAADVLLVAEAMSPLQYPTQGVKVQPLKTILIPGLGLKEEAKPDHTVFLKATLGVFDVAATVSRVTLTGAGKQHMILSSPSLSALNRQLQFVTYTNTVFHPKTADTVEFATKGHTSFFIINVGHKMIPKLHNSGPQQEYNITALVTIATKTFLRYDKLKDLIDSVRQFYPTVTIVIADDNEHPQPVTGPYIEHYIMPFGKGWFAGRNLAVSQVTTKYVLWVDDDFIFTSNTKLEKMVDILEKTTLDLVGGAVREVTGYTATFRHTISVEEGGDDGDCLNIRLGYHHVIKDYPNCVVADAVINFFMVRTDKVQQIGFDPRLARKGHLEFFIDALGSLHIGSCSDVIVSHASKIQLPWTKTDMQKNYEKFRYTSSKTDSNIFNEIFYFKNRFKCMTSN
ncbi:beta-1,4 N-acetylgalactosaminyltransferase 1a [Gouania willdenowi]|nr:beta-1,4 N-acetylgalactosaminyltransferase 1-like [Gouania willdenowi]